MEVQNRSYEYYAIWKQHRWSWAFWRSTCGLSDGQVGDPLSRLQQPRFHLMSSIAKLQAVQSAVAFKKQKVFNSTISIVVHQGYLVITCHRVAENIIWIWKLFRITVNHLFRKFAKMWSWSKKMMFWMKITWGIFSGSNPVSVPMQLGSAERPGSLKNHNL